MTQKLNLYTTQSEFEGLHRVADTRRSTIKVSTEALQHLLMDYSALLAAVQGSTSFKVLTLAKHRDRPKINRAVTD